MTRVTKTQLREEIEMAREAELLGLGLRATLDSFGFTEVSVTMADGEDAGPYVASVRARVDPQNFTYLARRMQFALDPRATRQRATYPSVLTVGRPVRIARRRHLLYLWTIVLVYAVYYEPDGDRIMCDMDLALRPMETADRPPWMAALEWPNNEETSE